MNATKSTGQIIKELRESQGMTQSDLAKEMNVSRQIISYYETNARMPNIDDIKRFAKRFNVSADYLLGLSPNPTTDPEVKAICSYTGLSEEAVSELHNTKGFVNSCNNERAIIDESLREYAHSRENALNIVNLFIEGHMSQFGNHLYKYKLGIAEAVEEHRAYLNDWIAETEENEGFHVGHYFCFSFPRIVSEEGNAKERLAKYELYEAADDFKSFFKELASDEERALKEIKAEYKKLEEAEEAALTGGKEHSIEEAKDSENNGNDN